MTEMKNTIAEKTNNEKKKPEFEKKNSECGKMNPECDKKKLEAGKKNPECGKKKLPVWLISVLILIGTVFAVLAAYVTYVFAAYYRVEDMQDLEIVTETVPASDGSQSVRSLSAEPPETGTRYRLVSANIGFGAYSDDYSFFMDGGKESRARSAEEARRNIQGEASAVAAQDPDFVFIQELDLDGTRSCHIDQREDMRRAFAGREVQSVFAQNFDSPYLFYPFSSPIGANLSGIMTYSTFPVSSALRRSLPVEDSYMKIVDLDRCYSVSRIPVTQGHELLLYNFHLSAYTSDGSIANSQLELLCRDMKAEYEAGNWCVAGGDFNKDLLGNSAEIFGGTSGLSGNWAQPIPDDLIPEGITLIVPFDPDSPQASCRTASEPYDPLTTFRITVDGFLVSDNVRTVESAVIDTGFKWSDHNPVRLDFILT